MRGKRVPTLQKREGHALRQEALHDGRRSHKADELPGGIRLLADHRRAVPVDAATFARNSLPCGMERRVN